MKHKLVLAAILGVIASMGVSAQGMPVIDISSITTAIYNGATMLEQLQTMYDNLKTSYNQLQQQIKNYESFDVNQLDANDPLGSWNSIKTYADRIITYQENIGAIINRRDIKVGNESYSLNDIFTAPTSKIEQSLLPDGYNFNGFDPFEKFLTLEERDAFHKKYGMSYGYHIRLKQMGDMLKKKSTEVFGYTANLQKNLAEDRERLQSIAEDSFGSESIIQQQQVNNAMLSIMAQDTKTQADLLGGIAEQLSLHFSQIQMEKEALHDELNMNALDFSEGFLKMIEEMPSQSSFR